MTEKNKSLAEMSQKQMNKREDVVKSMKKKFSDFRKRYGDKAKSVMYATATKTAMKEEEEQEEEVYIEHWCAKHVYHDVFGEGVVLEGEHAVPDEDGNIEWYTVEFPHGKETVFTEDVQIMHERMHGHMMKKKKKMSEEHEELDEVSKDLMMRYADKALDRRRKASNRYRSEINTAQSDGEEPVQAVLDMNKKEFDKRTKGLKAVGRRLRKEETEEVEEKVKHPNQQVLDVHEPEKDELTAKDFEMLRKMKKARK